MNKKLIALTLLLCLLLCACGSAKSASTTTASGGAADSMMAPSYDMAAPEASIDTAEDAGSGSGSAAISKQTDLAEKIIYSANAELETTDFDHALTAIDALVADYGGFVESSSVSGTNYYSSANNRCADFTVRIPADRFGDLKAALDQIGNVVYYNTYAENITSQYYDTQSQLDAYQTEQARLLEILGQCTTVEDMITVESRLSEVRYHLESLTTTLKNWQTQVDYSTLSLSLQEVKTLTDEAPVSYGGRIISALRDTLRAMRSFAQDGLIVLICGAVVLFVPAIVVAIVIVLIHRSVKNRRRAKQSTPPHAPSPADDSADDPE
ncbi:MAG: DUF4349 domain-containing protein [Oscillospiraceae bacterium]|nr:DUF4349 domain-containing protein [Oscillospiraceae bacterium]